MAGATKKVEPSCPACGRPFKNKQTRFSCDMGCLMVAIGIVIIMWAAAGFPKFWE